MEAEEAVMEVAHIEFDVTSVYVRDIPRIRVYELMIPGDCFSSEILHLLLRVEIDFGHFLLHFGSSSQRRS